MGKKSTSISFGGKGLRYTINSHGKRTTSVGIPGSGLYYTTTNSSSTKSYKTKSYQTHQQLKDEQRRLQKEQEIELARVEVELFENQCEIVKSIHKGCNDYINWQQILTSPPPYKPGEIGPKEKEARQKLKQYKPSFFERLFQKDQNKIAEFTKDMEQAKLEDEAEYRNWEELVAFSSVNFKVVFQK